MSRRIRIYNLDVDHNNGGIVEFSDVAEREVIIGVQAVESDDENAVQPESIYVFTVERV